MKLFKHRLMAPIDDAMIGEAGGGTSSVQDKTTKPAEAAATTEQEEVVEPTDLESIKAENARLALELKKHKDAETDAQKKLNDIELAKRTAEEKQAQEEKNFEKLYNITKEKVDKLEQASRDLELREEEKFQATFKTKQEEAFLKHLGAEVANPKLLKMVNYDKIVLNKESKNPWDFNSDGLDQAVEEYKADFGEAGIKKASAAPTQKQNAAPSGAKAKVESDFAKRASKLNLI